jgi:hypothetical protein
LSKDGEFLVATGYCKPGKQSFYTEGMLVEKYDATLEVKSRAVIPFSSATLDACRTSDHGGLEGPYIFRQRAIKLHELDNGYALVTEQQYQVPYGQTSATFHNNLICFGLNRQLEGQYQHVVRQFDKRIDFIPYRGSDSYGSGDKVYIFHPGVKENVKNTPDEFDVFCTSWEHGKTNPSTTEVQRPYSDFDMILPGMDVLDKDKLIFTVRGKGGTVFSTMSLGN